MDQSIHNSSQRGTAVYYTPAASGDHGPGSAPNCTQCIQYTVPGNHHTLDKHKHVRRTCQQRHPKNIFRKLHGHSVFEKQNFSMSMEKYFTSECSEQLKCFLLAKGTWYTLYTIIIHMLSSHVKVRITCFFHV